MPTTLTPDGTLVVAYDAEGELAPRPASALHEKDILSHIQRNVGPSAYYYEAGDSLAGLKVHVVPASADFPFLRLVTSGMSDIRMTPPPEASQLCFAELSLLLPQDWDLSTNDWPLSLIFWLMQLPHIRNSWLWEEHSVHIGAPGCLGPGIGYTDVLIGPVLSAEPEFSTLKTAAGNIHFFSVIPLYPEETTLKLNLGTDVLYSQFDANGLDDVVRETRINSGLVWVAPEARLH
jgi:hypothetical protein